MEKKNNAARPGLFAIVLSWLLVGLSVASITGCASLQYAGVASYSVEPIDIGGKPHCCRVEIHNGKEIDRLDARIDKRGDDYSVSLKQWKVEAFEGQKIAADAATVSTNAAARVATSVMVAPAVATVGAAAIGAIAK